LTTLLLQVAQVVALVATPLAAAVVAQVVIELRQVLLL
jgi:hypothetical protein